MTEYCDIPNHPGYRAGSDGSIWSCHNGRWGPSDRWRRLVHGVSNKYGRQHVVLGRGNIRYVHHLVLETFVGPKQEGYECRHLDGDAGNNTLSNLCWGIRDENIADMRYHGRNKGTRHYHAVLSNDDIRIIRSRSAAGETSARIAPDFNIHDSTVRKIVRCERWSHVT